MAKHRVDFRDIGPHYVVYRVKSPVVDGKLVEIPEDVYSRYVLALKEFDTMQNIIELYYNEG